MSGYKRIDEKIVLVDENGASIGFAEKQSSHHGSTPLHKAFSCYVFDDDGKLLVTKRASSKEVWPGAWTNSVCGHPGPGEKDVEAIQRRMSEELGMEVKDIKLVLPDYRYKSPPLNGIIENEICPVYFARLSNSTNINTAEVEDIKWVKWEDFVREAGSDSDDSYSWWCKDQLKQLVKSPQLQEYAKQ